MSITMYYTLLYAIKLEGLKHPIRIVLHQHQIDAEWFSTFPFALRYCRERRMAKAPTQMYPKIIQTERVEHTHTNTLPVHRLLLCVHNIAGVCARTFALCDMRKHKSANRKIYALRSAVSWHRDQMHKRSANGASARASEYIIIMSA